MNITLALRSAVLSAGFHLWHSSRIAWSARAESGVYVRLHNRYLLRAHYWRAHPSPSPIPLSDRISFTFWVLVRPKCGRLTFAKAHTYLYYSSETSRNEEAQPGAECIVFKHANDESLWLIAQILLIIKQEVVKYQIKLVSKVLYPLANSVRRFSGYIFIDQYWLPHFHHTALSFITFWRKEYNYPPPSLRFFEHFVQ